MVDFTAFVVTLILRKTQANCIEDRLIVKSRQSLYLGYTLVGCRIAGAAVAADIEGDSYVVVGIVVAAVADIVGVAFAVCDRPFYDGLSSSSSPRLPSPN